MRRELSLTGVDLLSTLAKTHHVDSYSRGLSRSIAQVSLRAEAIDEPDTGRSVKMLDALDRREAEYYSAEVNVVDDYGKSPTIFRELEEHYGFVGGSPDEYRQYFHRADLPAGLWEFRTEEGVKAVSHGRWLTRCPAHDDRNPSLSITVKGDGKILIHCFAGCSPAAVVNAVGLELSDLFPDKLRSGDGADRRASLGPQLAYVLAGPGGEASFERDYADIGSGLVLPPSPDPTAIRWPVEGLNVKVLGQLPERQLLRLIASLRRDGAAVVVGEDTSGKNHVVGGRL